MREKTSGRAVFTWRYYLFGKNIVAGCFLMLSGIVLFIVSLATLSWWLGI